MRFPGNLYEHQKAAVRKMIETGGRTALLLEPGLGKSQAVIRYLDWFAVQRKRAGNSKPVRVLIVAPLSATDTWRSRSRSLAGSRSPSDARASGAGSARRSESATPGSALTTDRTGRRAASRST